jgi:hypothetical protein
MVNFFGGGDVATLFCVGGGAGGGKKIGLKKSQCFLEFIDCLRLAKVKLTDNMARSINDKMLVWEGGRRARQAGG